MQKYRKQLRTPSDIVSSSGHHVFLAIYSTYLSLRVWFDPLSCASAAAPMGITGFTEWFKTTFPFAVQPITERENAAEFDHVLVDMNQFIHLHIRRANNEEHLLIKVFSHLDKLFKLIWPRQSVLLALDGPGTLFFSLSGNLFWAFCVLFDNHLDSIS